MPNALNDFTAVGNGLLGLGPAPMRGMPIMDPQGRLVDPRMLAIKRMWAAIEKKKKEEELALRMEILRKNLMSSDALKDPAVLEQERVDALRRRELLGGISR